MYGKKKFILWSLCLLILGGFLFSSVVFADISPTPTPTPSDNSAYNDLLNKINDLTNKINDLKGQEQTLSSQITVFDSQIKLTEYRIEATKQQIVNLEEDIDTAQKKISSLEDSLANLTKVLVNRMITGYTVGSQNSIEMLLASGTITDFFQRASYLQIVEHHDKELAYDTVQAKNDYANQKQIFLDKEKQILALKAQLESYTSDLNSQKAAKQELLSETQGSEDVYQQELAAAKAQLAGFSSFAANQGGASLLSNQTYCDDWGCYYNQRDSQWGNTTLNSSVGTPYTIASDGCLLTSMAMIYTHYGHRSVSPVTINSISSNFASYYPAFLKYTITADGATSQRAGSYLDSILSGGDPAIVGIRYGNGDTHFVVIKSKSGSDYIMDDPFTPNGHDITFASKYSMSSIFEIDKVTF